MGGEAVLELPKYLPCLELTDGPIIELSIFSPMADALTPPSPPAHMN